jgi:hypothetical protein
MRLLGGSITCTMYGVLILSGIQACAFAQDSQLSTRNDQSIVNARDQFANKADTLTSTQAQVPTTRENASLVELPDSPGTAFFRSQDAAQQNSSTAPSANQSSQSQSQASSQQSNEPQSSQSQTAPPQNLPAAAPDQKPQRPVGTAAAEAPVISGVTAAQPAGVAIAPAKQRRVRTLVIKIGAIVGAGVAVGTTVALTAGTSSKPPGAH